MHNAAQFLRDVVPLAPPQPVQLSEHKVADPKHFKGDPEDVTGAPRSGTRLVGAAVEVCSTRN